MKKAGSVTLPFGCSVKFQAGILLAHFDFAYLDVPFGIGSPVNRHFMTCVFLGQVLVIESMNFLVGSD